MLKGLTMEQQKRVRRALQLLQADPRNPSLRNHTLRGKHSGMKSISAGYDLRILYRTEANGSIAILMMVGTHDEVY